MAASEVHIRELNSMDDLNATIELQLSVWGMQPYECASPYTMNAAIHNGGCVIGAEVDGQLVGFCFGFAAKRGDEIWLWSHMAGVHPDYQGMQIGTQLKLAQKDWALKNGYSIMGWTFHPMQRGNAHFNFNHLGAIAKTYYVNHYGEAMSGINAGLASDRLEALWRLDIPYTPSQQSHTMEPFLLYLDENGDIISEYSTDFDAESYCIEIPYDIASLKQTDIEKVKNWQLKFRQVTTGMLNAGYIVSGFITDKNRCWYTLTPEDHG